MLSIPFTAQANSNYPAAVALINDQGFLSGATTLDPNAPGIEVCAGQSQCFKWKNVYYPTQAATEQAIAASTAYPTDSKAIVGNHNNNTLVIVNKPYDPSWDPEGICLGASECYYVPDGSVHTHINPANQAWLQYQLEQTFPENVWEVTGNTSLEPISDFDHTAPGADACLNNFGCYIVNGTYYPTLGDAKDAYIAFNQAALEASYPDTTYEVTGINDDGTAILSEVEFDYSILNADNCLNNGDCYLADGAYYTTELLAKAILEQAIEQAAIAAAEAYQAILDSYPTESYGVHKVYSDGNVSIHSLAFDHTQPGAEVCLGQQKCFKLNGNYYTSVGAVEDAWWEFEAAALAAAEAQAALEASYPNITYVMTGVNTDGTLAVYSVNYNPDAEGADVCIGVHTCMIVKGKYYPGPPEAAVAWAEWEAEQAQIALEASYPTATYMVTGFGTNGAVDAEAIEFDYSLPGADSCLNGTQCYLVDGMYYPSAYEAKVAWDAWQEEIAAAEQAALEATYPGATYIMTNLASDGSLDVVGVPFDYNAPGAEICLNVSQCIIVNGTYYPGTGEAVAAWNAWQEEIAAAEAAEAAAAELATKVAETAAINAPIRFDQYSDPIATDSFDAVDNFQYQKSATQHRIRLRIADNTYFNDSWATSDVSDTQALIVKLTQNVFEQGFNEGYEDGFNEGYQDGYKDGYIDGHNDFLNN